MDEEISSESEDELIPKSKFDELEKSYKSLSRKYQEAIAEGKELRKLNVELQTCLVAKILCGYYYYLFFKAPHSGYWLFYTCKYNVCDLIFQETAHLQALSRPFQ